LCRSSRAYQCLTVLCLFVPTCTYPFLPVPIVPCLFVPTRSHPCLVMPTRAYRALLCLPVPTVPCHAYPCLPCLVMSCLPVPICAYPCRVVCVRAIPCVFVPIRVVSSHVSCRILCHDVLCWDLLTVRVVS
jgi:hypothetical protein